MAKTESTFKNMVMSLTLISLVASACLAFVYEMTKEPIAASALNKKLDAIRQIVPDFTNNPDQEMYSVSTGNGDSLNVYPAKKDGELVAYVVNTYSKIGFAGDISLMAGFKPDGTIINIAVLEQKETPGLGTKMTEPKFKDQFNEKNPGNFKIKVKKDGGDVDAITSATISSRAFCDAVQRAYNAVFNKNNADASSGSTQKISNMQSDSKPVEKGGTK